MALNRRHLLAASPLLLAGPRLLHAADSKSAPAFVEITEKSTAAVRKGNEFMLKTMNRDGGCGVDVGQGSDIGCTAMVGMSLMSQGNTPIEGPYNSEIRKIIGYMLKIVENMPSDNITSANGTQLQNKIGKQAHSFFATVFLSQAMGMGLDSEQIRKAMTKLVSMIVRQQDSKGSWGNDAWAPVLGTVMGWLALRASHMVGMEVGGSPELTAKHLITQMKQQLGQNGGWMHTLYKNATGVRVLYAMGMENEEISKRAFKDVLQLVSKDNTAFTQAGGEEYIAFHLITETMLQKGGADWRTWLPVIRDRIIGVQNRDGSWTGHHCITSRTFCTAAACLVLTSPNRYLPISQP